MTDSTSQFYTIFDKPGSHLYWENYIDYAPFFAGIGPKVAKDWVEALEYLRSQLGDGFLREMKNSHPFANLITTLTPWHITRTIHYADILRDLQQNDPGYSAFLKKLRSPVGAKNEMMDFLYAARILNTTGLITRFPKAIPDRKNPDLQIIDPNTGQSVSAEISRMDDSGERTLQNQSYKSLASILRRHLRNPLHSARQLSVPIPAYYDTLPTVLYRLQDQVEAWGGHAQYKDDYLEIDLFPLDNFAVFNSWLDENDRRKGFNGMPLNFDDTKRVSDRKIKTEAGHFIPVKTGLIIFPCSPFHFMHQKSTEIIQAFKHRLSRYPNIIGIYTYAEIMESDASLIADKGYLRKQVDNGITQYSLYVENDLAKPFDPEIRQKLLDAFRSQKAMI